MGLMFPAFMSFTIFAASSIYFRLLDVKSSILCCRCGSMSGILLKMLLKVNVDPRRPSGFNLFLCRMQTLRFPAYDFRFTTIGDKTAIFDQIRKKFVVLTPEEWVRQHVVCFLITDKGFPKSLINVEKLLKINGIV